MSTRYPGDGVRFPRFIGSVALCAAILLSLAPAFAQGGADATPVRASLVTPTPESAQASAPTITPSYTATSLPAARLQALQSAGNVNVRALPDVESDLLGTIANGSFYPVLRNYYRWYELGFDSSPNGRAWVYGDLVTIEGDPSQIEAIDNFDAVALPGGLALSGAEDSAQADANPQTIDIATVEAGGANAVEVIDATPLPTYTPPATQPSLVHQLEVVEGPGPRLRNLPPLVPILALAGLGFAGLLISLLRT